MLERHGKERYAATALSTSGRAISWRSAVSKRMLLCARPWKKSCDQRGGGGVREQRCHRHRHGVGWERGKNAILSHTYYLYGDPKPRLREGLPASSHLQRSQCGHRERQRAERHTALRAESHAPSRRASGRAERRVRSFARAGERVGVMAKAAAAEAEKDGIDGGYAMVARSALRAASGVIATGRATGVSRHTGRRCMSRNLCPQRFRRRQSLLQAQHSRSLRRGLQPTRPMLHRLLMRLALCMQRKGPRTKRLAAFAPFASQAAHQCLLHCCRLAHQEHSRARLLGWGKRGGRA